MPVRRRQKRRLSDRDQTLLMPSEVHVRIVVADSVRLTAMTTRPERLVAAASRPRRQPETQTTAVQPHGPSPSHAWCCCAGLREEGRRAPRRSLGRGSLGVRALRP
jgi:hypothetical protein